MATRATVRCVSSVLLITAIAACEPKPRDAQADVSSKPSVRVIELTQKLTTFRPSSSAAADKRFTADLTAPIGPSRRVPAFSDQMLLVENADFPTGDGKFKLNTTVLPENLGTSMDHARCSSER